MLGPTIKEFARANPFSPFALQMTDGRRFIIVHPDYISISPQGSRVIVYDREEHETHLSGLLVASVEPLKSSRRRGGRRST
jgi:hypothetical protein